MQKQTEGATITSMVHRRHVVYGVLISVLLFAGVASLLRLSPYRQVSSYQYYRAEVTQVEAGQSPTAGALQNVKVRLLDGPQKRDLVTIQRSIAVGDAAARRLPVGSEVLLGRQKSDSQYSFISRWYMPGAATLFTVLLALVIVFGAWRGVTSMLGLTISIFILAAFVVPRIVNGSNAFITCIEGAVLITLVSVYIAHGPTKRTTVALAGSLLTLSIVVGITAFASYAIGTSEVITEDNVGVLYAAHPIDIAGLLTGGVVIASLGTLFDITTGQAAVVDEIHKADRRQSTLHLFWKGMSVGREHIAALINTLALVYVGVALPSIVTTIVLNQEYNYHPPLLVNLNTETLAEEVVRTCVASIGMLLALPITTWLAAYVLPRWTPAVDRKLKIWLREW
ncbi:MAG TPA: YibE/F family protein [Verrucomicrobiae bacterium]|nr:YibE/F family protein [Verrucomicrobiae bacterium]